jgi:hypothetical protein
MIAIDPTRYGLAANLGGAPDADGSMYGVDTGQAPCAGASAETGCVDASTDFISFATQGPYSMMLTFVNAVSAAKNSLVLSYDSLPGDAGDKIFCRDHSAPFAPAEWDGTCASGTCDFALPPSYNATYIVRHNVGPAKCLDVAVPNLGCTGPGAGTVWRYYPIFVSGGDMCSASGNTLTLTNGNPETFTAGDSLQPYYTDGTHTSAYAHAYLAQLIEEATWEEMFVPRVNMIPGGDMENTTADGTGADCVTGDVDAGWSFVADGGAWNAFTGQLDGAAGPGERTAVYGLGCYGLNEGAPSTNHYATTPLIAVAAGSVYTIVGMIQTPTDSSGSRVQIVDQAGSVIDPTPAATVIAAWGPRGGADYDPLTYDATGLNGAASLDFPRNQTTSWAPLVAKITIPAGVTGIRIRIGNGTTNASLMLDEFYMYPSIVQNMRMNPIFKDGKQCWAMTGDSREGTYTYGIDATHTGTFGMLDWAHQNGHSNRPSIAWFCRSGLTDLWPSQIDAVGGRTISIEVALPTPYPLFDSLWTTFGFVALGLNDVNGKQAPDQIEENVVKSRNSIASRLVTPVWVLEAPWKGAVGTDPAAQACNVSTSAPDFSRHANNCGSAILSINRRILHDGVAW